MKKGVFRRGVINSLRLVFLVILMLTVLVVGSNLILSLSDSGSVPHQGLFNMSPANQGSLDWSKFDFSGLPYASNGDGKFDRFFSCAGGGASFCAPTWDLRSVWVAQDSNFIAWKITGKNFSNASFCSGSSVLAFEIEFDADGNVSTGCRPSGDPCYPGADYHIIVNSTGNGSLLIFNSSQVSGPCPAGNCYNESTNVTVFVNISKTGARCDSDPSTVRVAINKSQLKWSVLTFNVVSKGVGGPIDLIGANRQEFSSDLGMATGTFFEKEGNSSFMFRDSGCGSFTNQSYCESGALNGNFSCVWESDFSNCRPNFEDTGNYGCSDFCGACSTSGDCSTGARNTCQWTGSFCVEDFTKFRFGGNCDDKCNDCFGQNACTNSRASGGCSWISDPVTGKSFCGEAGTTIKGCGPNTEATSCSNCNATGCISVANGGACAWENTSNFCYMNVGNLEYSCFDGADNNGNGLIDCNDPGCSTDKFCGGGEFDKKILTDTVFVTTMKMFGICTETSSGISCNKERAMLFESARAMDDKPGPPIKLKDDTDMATEPPASHKHLDILGFGFKDMGKSIGMGMMLGNGSASAACPNSTNGTGLYYYFLDTDGSQSTGCWEMINRTNVSGIEYKLVYNVSINASTSIERRQAFRCLSQNTSSFGLFPAKLTTPTNPFNPSQTPICTFGAAILVVPLSDIGNPKDSIVYHLATVDGLTAIPNMSNDTLFNATYTPGSVEFIPPNCDSNPMACGTAFAKLGGGKFTPFEDCAPGSPDEDQDGNANCADADCAQAPWCAPNRSTLLANDKTAPRVMSNIIDEFDRFAMLRQSTSELSNLSLEFYNASSACTVAIANLTDAAQGTNFETDRYRPWHSLTFDNTTITAPGTTPLRANTTYYYRTKNCDLSGNCAISACLNFTTKTTGSTNFNFGILFDPRGSPTMSGLNLTYFNGSEYVHFSIRNISYISNTTMRFDNPNASFNGSTSGWNMEFEGVDIAKATSINMTDMIQVSQVNESNKKARMLVGMNGTKWQEMAQVLGIDSVVINISQVGNRIIKCDLNGSGCLDVSSNITIIKQGSNYTTIRIPTYGLGGFSAYGVNNTGVELKSDRTVYQCYPGCTVYWNVTNYQANYSQVLNVTVKVNDTSRSSTYNISYLNLSNLSQWVPVAMNNESNISNYTFTIVNSAALNATVHQFRVEVNMSAPVADFATFNFTVTNNSGWVSSWKDDVWFDTINITNEELNLSNTQSPAIRFMLLSLNDSNQSCTLRINGTSLVNGTVVNNTLATFVVNSTLQNGTYTYNISCLNSESNEVGNSSVRTLRVHDAEKPLFNQTPSSSSPSASSITLSWTTNERANGTISFGSSSTAFTTNTTESAGFSEGHRVIISSGLSASTTYYYNATSCDVAGNCNTTGPHNFTTSASASSSSSSSGGSSSGGGAGAGNQDAAATKVSKVWAELPVGANVMNIVKSDFAVRKVIIETGAVAASVTVDVTKLTGAPSATGVAPGTVYQYLQFDASNLPISAVKTVTMQFSVEKKWLASNSLVKDNIGLYRHSGGKWNELSTKILSEDTINVNYEASTPGFSVFAVAAKSSPAAAGNETPSGPTGAVVETNESASEEPSGESGVNQSAQPSLLPNLQNVAGIPLLNLMAISIVVIAVLGVIVYFVSKRKKEGN